MTLIHEAEQAFAAKDIAKALECYLAAAFSEAAGDPHYLHAARRGLAFMAEWSDDPRIDGALLDLASKGDKASVLIIEKILPRQRANLYEKLHRPLECLAACIADYAATENPQALRQMARMALHNPDEAEAVLGQVRRWPSEDFKAQIVDRELPFCKAVHHLRRNRFELAHFFMTQAALNGEPAAIDALEQPEYTAMRHMALKM